MPEDLGLLIPSVFGLSELAQAIVMNAKTRESGEYARLYEASRPLYEYVLTDGRVYLEKIQPNTAGKSRNLFLALQDKNGEWLFDSFWRDAEIAEIREITGEEDPVALAIKSGELQEVQ